jgi:uncharacterized protein (DUF885 family)
MRSAPTWATRLGDHRFDAELWRERPEDIADARARNRAFLDRARAIDAKSLDASDQESLALFIEHLEAWVALEVCETEQWSISAYDNNPVTQLNRLSDGHPIREPADAANLVSRYRQIPRVVDERIANLRRGKAKGLVGSHESLRRLVTLLDRQFEQPLASSPLLGPVSDAARAERKKAARLSEADEARFSSELREAVEKDVLPAFRRFRQVVAEELLPAARPDDKEGLFALPEGAACYRALTLLHVGEARDPAAVHELGLREIERIDGEMRALGEKIFGLTDLPSILARLRDDRALYFKTGPELLAAAEAALNKARAALPRLFSVLPKTDCVVRPIPDDEAPFTTLAYYREPHYDGTKPGEYMVNTYKPETRSRIEIEALSYHESIPGHHLQIALAQEAGEVPAFRKFGGSTAFVEGWALYTERLANEEGLYAGDLDRMGMLSYDAWRASRLVVDTGLHAMGWTRARAEQFMREHTALTETNIVNEVDRYIAVPGQALAYKIGQLEILRLRDEARAALGSRFDLRGFHDAVLARGAVSLKVLRHNVDHWIAAQRATP